MATMASATHVRDAQGPDLDSVRSVLRAANREFEALLPSAFYRAYLADVLDIESRFEDTQLLVAAQAGGIVGTITLYPDASREGWGWPSHWTGIRAVAVDPPARGFGIGHQLAQACIDRSRALGAQAVCLHTASFMRAATAMYQRIGFRRVPELDGDAAEMFGVGVIDPRIDALAYRLDLEREE
jgi:predicted N-acetyltransferase YhbS